MSDPTATDCSIVTVARQCTAVVKGAVPFAEFPQAQRSARAKVAAALPLLLVAPHGLACTRIGSPSGGKLYMEIGVMVARSFEPLGDVVPSELPAGRAAHYRMVGPFEGLPEAWPFLVNWCQGQGLKLAGINWEIYGQTAADPAKQETFLYALLA